MASSLLSSPLASGSSSESWKHDVFLSFREDGTRKTFVDHLYSALIQQGIYTYKDDYAIPRGRIVWSIHSEGYRGITDCRHHHIL